MDRNDEGPLARWSRLKTELREQQESGTEPALAVAAEGETDALDFAEPSDALPAIPDDGGAETAAEVPPLPPIEELDADSDYTQFLAKGVPEALTRAALRKLWLSDPVFANLDGLNDYDENFNLIDKLITAADTNYKVGRGMVTEEERLQEDEAAAEAAEETPADGAEETAVEVAGESGASGDDKAEPDDDIGDV
jgi:hypothetical protein